MNHPTIPQETVEQWHHTLLETPKWLEYLKEKRGLSQEVIDRYFLGWDGERITIPVFDAEGKCVNVRRYFPHKDPSKKMLNTKGYGETRLYPLDQLQEEGGIAICEGEWDALLLISRGYLAVTNTNGASNWDSTQNELFRSRFVILSSDNDQAGLARNHRIVSELQGIAEEIMFIDWSGDPAIGYLKGGDVTDFLVKWGRPIDELWGLGKPVDKLPPLPKEDKPKTNASRGHKQTENFNEEQQRLCYDYFAQAVKGKVEGPDGKGECRALCPLHEETVPSFIFNVRKGAFHCFGCGKGGGLKDFSEFAGIPIPKELLKKKTKGKPTNGFGEITPGLDFTNGVVYVTVPKIVIPENKPKPIQVQEVITSKGERFLLTEESLLSRGFYTTRYPHPQPRWSDKSIEAFLTKKESPSLKDLFAQIRDQYRRYIDFLDSRVYSLLSVWVIGTYFHRLFSAYPYIHLNGDPQVGKTKTLELTALIAFNGELTFHSTPAYIVRSISDNHCVCCVDEAERLKPSKDEDRQLVISMYNSGYKRGSMSGKVEAGSKKGKWEVRRFEAYSPKMFASIKQLDPVLKTRCIPIVMVESSNFELKNRTIRPEDPTFQSIRDGLYRAMMAYHEPVRELYYDLTDKEIGGREWELWAPILSIALAIDGDGEDQAEDVPLYRELRGFALEAGKEKRRQREEETSTPKLLLTFQELLGDQEEGFYPTSELAGALNRYDDEYFGWMTEDETQKTKGRVGRFLKQEIHRLAIGEKKIDRTEGVQKRGYTLYRKAIQDRLKGIGLS